MKISFRREFNILTATFFVATLLFNCGWVGHFFVAKIDSEAAKPSPSELVSWFFQGFDVQPKEGTLYSEPQPSDTSSSKPIVRAKMNRINPLFPVFISALSTVGLFIISSIDRLRVTKRNRIIQRTPLAVTIFLFLSVIALAAQVANLTIEGRTYGMIPLAFQMIFAAIISAVLAVNKWDYYYCGYNLISSGADKQTLLDFRKTIESTLKLVNRIGIAALISLVIGFTQILKTVIEVVVSNRVELYLFLVIAFGLGLSLALIFWFLLHPLLLLFEEVDSAYLKKVSES